MRPKTGYLVLGLGAGIQTDTYTVLLYLSDMEYQQNLDDKAKHKSVFRYGT